MQVLFYFRSGVKRNMVGDLYVVYVVFLSIQGLCETVRYTVGKLSKSSMSPAKKNFYWAAVDRDNRVFLDPSGCASKSIYQAGNDRVISNLGVKRVDHNHKVLEVQFSRVKSFCWARMSRDCMFLGIVRYCVTIGPSFLTCNTKIYLPLVESLSGCLLFVSSTLAQSTLRWVTFSKCFESEILLIHTTFRVI